MSTISSDVLQLPPPPLLNYRIMCSVAFHYIYTFFGGDRPPGNLPPNGSEFLCAPPENVGSPRQKRACLIDKLNYIQRGGWWFKKTLGEGLLFLALRAK